jgi:DNA-binding response OmpR family regulator
VRILVADDDAISRRLLENLLAKEGYQVHGVCSGREAWEVLSGPDPVPLAVLDWMMPDLDGPEVCRLVRKHTPPLPTYLILLTSRNRREDLLLGLESGADDYVTKPFDPAELRARVKVGVRVTELQNSLAARVRQLEEALANVRQLQKLLPICAFCKRIRDDSNYWAQVEEYLSRHTAAQFSHGICPECWKTKVEPQLAAIKNDQSSSSPTSA